MKNENNLKIGTYNKNQLAEYKPIIITSPLGIFYMVLSSLCFTGMNFFSKLMYENSQITPFEAIYFRGLTMFLFGYIYSFYLKVDVMQIPAPVAFSLWIRTIFGTAGICLNFIGNKVLPLSVSTSLFYIYPLNTSLGAYLFLKEKMNKLEILGLFSSFIGVLMVINFSRNSDLKSSMEIPIYYYLFPIIGSFTTTVVHLVTRKMGLDIHYLINPTWYGFVQCYTVTPIWLFIRSSTFSYWDIKLHTLISVFMMCICSWLAQMFMTRALQIEKAGRVAAVGYLQIPLMFISDLWYFKLELNWQIALGSFLIVGCNFITGLLRLLNIYE